jgi:hypothetical protein
LVLVHDDAGVAVAYSGLARGGATHEVCPLSLEDSAVSGIDIYLQSANNQSPIDALLDRDGWFSADISSLVKPIQDAFGLTTTELHRLLVDGDESTCFTTPAALWGP